MERIRLYICLSHLDNSVYSSLLPGVPMGGGRGGRVPPLTGSRRKKKGKEKKRKERKEKEKKKREEKKEKKRKKEKKKKERKKEEEEKRKKKGKEKERKKMGKLKKKDHGRTHQGGGGQLTPDILKTYSFFPENVV